MYFRYSLRKRKLEQLIGLTDYFTWEDLPTRDPDTGYLTKAAYISIIQRLTKYLFVALFGYHAPQSTFRIVMYHDTIFTAWYPFDVSASPAYEIVNFTQVKSNT
jgi:hypothetical protein